MSRYESKEVAFDLPRDWEDRSVIAYASPAAPQNGPAPNVVMTREPMEANDTLQSYADRQLVDLAKRLNGFELADRKEFSLAANPAIELRFAWQGESGKLAQRMIIIASRKRVASTFTSTSSFAEAGRNDAVFDRIFSSIRINDA